MLHNRDCGGRYVAGLLLAAAAACEPIDDVREVLLPEPDTPREAYFQSLQIAGLDRSALARDWAAAAARALAAPARVATPYREAGYLAVEQPGALGLRFEARRGWRIVVELEMDADTGSLFFVEAFRAARDGEDGPLLLAAADSGLRPFTFQAHRDGEYIVRLQPELLRGGRYTVELRAGPSLAFPVEAGGNQDVGSVFGDPRDGGVRDHHGIDIFARRGTPALAAADGIVARVEETPIGGKVVWMDVSGSGDRRSRPRLYYAHLDSQLVARGQRVRAGDTVGLVGNTGNARTTPPHLHFGVYQRGPINPYPFVARMDTVPPRIVADAEAVVQARGWARVVSNDVPLNDAPAGRARALDHLPRNAAVRLVAAAARSYRVELPDGRTGFIAASYLEPADQVLARRRIATASLVFDTPGSFGTVVDTVAAGTDVPVLAEAGEFLLVKGDEGRIGWLPEPATGGLTAAGETNGGM